jgi:hypothetical protein
MKRDLWVPHTKGGWTTEGYEICVIRQSDKHGKLSYGWIGDTKIQISTCGGPCRYKVSKLIWEKLVKVAQEVADELNAQEESDAA